MKIFFTTVSLLLFGLSNLAFSATKQAEIDVQVTHTPYVNFTGTAPGSTRTYDNDDISNWIFPIDVDIGTLGLESNISGNCSINFSTLNNFDLLHNNTTSSLIRYKILYRSLEFGRANNPPLTMLCNTNPSLLQFKADGFYFGSFLGGAFMQSGLYSDIITITVVTQ